MNNSAIASAAGSAEQHVAGETAVRRVHADLPADLEPFADDVRQVVEDLRQVAAGLALDEHGGDEEPHVEQIGTRSARSFSASLQRQAEVLLVERLLELGADRLGQLVGDHAHRGLERMTGANRARQQVERFWKMLFELLRAATTARFSSHERQ